MWIYWIFWYETKECNKFDKIYKMTYYTIYNWTILWYLKKKTVCKPKKREIETLKQMGKYI